MLREIYVVGDGIKLGTGGKALPVKVYRDRSPVRQIRSETILNLKLNHDLLDCLMLEIMKEIRKDFGKTRIQENTYADVRNRSHYLDSFTMLKNVNSKVVKSFLKKILLILLTYLC